MTQEEVDYVEKATIGQSGNKTWFDHRAARVTASNIKAACNTNPCMPSTSLIKRICYPHAYRFSTTATKYNTCTIHSYLYINDYTFFADRWGCSRETDAVEAYKAIVCTRHESFQITENGFFIDIDNPFIGASPDRIVSCKCCGKGVLEVKCPYCYRDNLPEGEQKNFCLTKVAGEWKLQRNHSYYFQVQTQMMVCRVAYCDFAVWTEKELVAERITIDSDFHQSMVDAVKHFFVCGVLPEIVGKWYTWKPVANSQGTVFTPSATSTGVLSLVEDSQNHEDLSML